MELKVVEVGDELAIIFPDELVQGLGVSIGDSVRLTESDSGIPISRCSEEEPHSKLIR